MIQPRLAWAAFKTMTHLALRDPIWAFGGLITLPFRAWKRFLQGGLVLMVVLYYVGMGGRFILNTLGFRTGTIPYIAVDLLTLVVLLLFAFRFLSAPIILRFGHDGDGETHGSARFASANEVAPLVQSQRGLLIGRDGKTGQLLATMDRRIC